MPSTSISLRPGVDTVQTPVLNSAGIVASNNIRFKDGLVQKRGGYAAWPGGTGLGAPVRALCGFRDGNNKLQLGAGLKDRLLAITGGAAQDITPVVVTATTTTVTTGTAAPAYVQPGISTTAGSNVFTVQDANYSVKRADVVTFYCPIYVGGAHLYGSYPVASVIDANHYTIVGQRAATQTVTNTFTMRVFDYLANNGYIYARLPGSTNFDPQSALAPLYYTGLYGVPQFINIARPVSIPDPRGGPPLVLSGSSTPEFIPDSSTFVFPAPGSLSGSTTYTENNGVFPVTYTTPKVMGGTVTTSNTSYSTSPATADDWSLASYGSMLMACASPSGLLYAWNSLDNVSGAQQITAAPKAAGLLVSDASQQVILYGAPAGSGSDPNYVAWCDTGNPGQWTAAVGNQAGSYRIPTGSGVVGAALAAQQILLWTDLDVWAMSYVGYPLVYSFTKLATGCGLIAQNAVAKVGSAVYWMSQNQFWVYQGGAVQPLACPVSDSVFPVLDAGNLGRIRAGGNSQFNEAIWFFPSAGGSAENDSYVCFNFAENTWDLGKIGRSAFVDQTILGPPLGGDALGNVFQHETSPDAAGAPLPCSFTTGFFSASEGEDLVFVDWMRPDFRFGSAADTVSVTLLVAEYAGDAPATFGPYPFNRATEWIDLRCRGRFVAFRFEGGDLGSFWRIGRVQMRATVDGRR